MSQKLLVNKFEWIKDTSQFNENFIKNYNEESDEGYFLEFDAQYLQKFYEIHNFLPFLPERIKIEKVEKFVTNLFEKTEYVIYRRNLKQVLNHGLILKKHFFKLINKIAFGKNYGKWENLEILNL